MSVNTFSGKPRGGIASRTGWSTAADPEQAVRELREQLDQSEPFATMFFVSSHYDLDRIAREVSLQFQGPVTGCTSAGGLCSAGFVDHGIVGASIPLRHMSLEPYLIRNINEFNGEQARELAERITANGMQQSGRMLGLLLVDGLSMREEITLANLQHALPEVPIFGGSAGDNMEFRRTFVYHDGRFHTNAAVLAILRTDLRFRLFKIQHFEPTEARLVITEAIPETRTVISINGYPAAEEYARLVGVSVEQLSTELYSSHPMLMRVGGEYYVRSIMKANPDGSLMFACAIDNGLVMRIGRGVGLVESLDSELARLKAEMPGLELIFGCDCAFRRLEALQKGLQDGVREVLGRYNFIGFNTYGEQINHLHVNQTLTGIALGGADGYAGRD
ncbi:FIST C-terminal domain-containing protein [bacterium]|nr:FIST C-terminal domain-containing protein [bacterium]